MDQNLSDVYANVRDAVGGLPGATGDGSVDDTASIQAAINYGLSCGKHVLFPAGTYRFDGVLEFNVAYQRCTFLAGATLVAGTNEAYVHITGGEQTFIGLRIEAPVGVDAHNPLLEIEGAARPTMQELRVSVGQLRPSLSDPPWAAVRVRSLNNCKFIGGSISGTGEAGTVGLWLTNWGLEEEGGIKGEPSEIGAVGLIIEKFGWAVRVDCIMDEPSFVDCSFTDNVEGAVILTFHDGGPVNPNATGLRLIGCHMAGGSPPQYVLIDGRPGVPCIWSGGVVIGCTFGSRVVELRVPGSLRPLPQPHPRSPLPPPSPADPLPWGRHDPLPPLPVLAGSGGGPETSARLPATQAGRSVSGRTASDVRAQSSVLRAPQPAKSTNVTRLAGAAGTRRVAAPIATSPPTQVRAFKPGIGPSTKGAGPRAQAVAAPGACVFRIRGTVQGVVVSGCSSEPELLARRSDVWDISDTASIGQTCDMFNSWAQANVATGNHAEELVQIGSDTSGKLTITAARVCLDAKALGFFEAEPVEREAYLLPGAGSRALHPHNAQQVLAQLLIDLSALGLIRRRRP